MRPVHLLTLDMPQRTWLWSHPTSLAVVCDRIHPDKVLRFPTPYFVGLRLQRTRHERWHLLHRCTEGSCKSGVSSWNGFARSLWAHGGHRKEHASYRVESCTPRLSAGSTRTPLSRHRLRHETDSEDLGQAQVSCEARHRPMSRILSFSSQADLHKNRRGV